MPAIAQTRRLAAAIHPWRVALPPAPHRLPALDARRPPRRTAAPRIARGGIGSGSWAAGVDDAVSPAWLPPCVIEDSVPGGGDLLSARCADESAYGCGRRRHAQVHPRDQRLRIRHA